MVQIINIDPAYERILSFLYPRYSIETELQKYDRFIVHKDITCPAERIRVENNYSDCIIISTKIYHELWDADLIKEKAIEFARVNFKCRKRTLSELSSEDPHIFIDNIISFMFTGELDFVEDEGITELFNQYGSVKFNELFMQKIEEYPPSKVIASMMTFITKILNPGQSVYYKKKNSVLEKKIRQNFEEAFTYLQRYGDFNNMHYLYFFQKLVSQ